MDVVEVRGKLFRSARRDALRARGVADWGGFLEFKRDRFPEAARASTAAVLRAVDADVQAPVEVESRPVLPLVDAGAARHVRHRAEHRRGDPAVRHRDRARRQPPQTTRPCGPTSGCSGRRTSAGARSDTGAGAACVPASPRAMA